ncbi:MAG: HNH endonuclease domain-containing protein, partial [Rhizobiaceae bacterium]
MGLLRVTCRLLAEIGLLPGLREERATLFAGRAENPDALHLAGRDIFRLARRRGPPCCRTCPQACFGSEEAVELCARRQSRDRLAEIWACLPPFAASENGLAALDNLLFGQRPPPERQRPRRGDPALRRALGAAGQLLDDLSGHYGVPDMIACEAAFYPERAERPKGRAGRLSLWRKAARNGQVLCHYTGAPISEAMARSRLTEIDHVLPLAASADFSVDNSVLCLAFANRTKGGRTPRRAFGGTAQWNGMLERGLPAAIARQLATRDLPPNKPSFPARQANLAAACGRGLIRLSAKRFPKAEPVLVAPSDVARLH